MRPLKRSAVALLFTALAISAPALAGDQLASHDEVIELIMDGDFERAQAQLDQGNREMLASQSVVESQYVAMQRYLNGVLAFYVDGDTVKAEAFWRGALHAFPELEWSSELAGGEGETLFAAVKSHVGGEVRHAALRANEELQVDVWVDGFPVGNGGRVYSGERFIQASCPDGRMMAVTQHLSSSEPLVCPCPGVACTVRVEPVVEEGPESLVGVWADWSIGETKVSAGQGLSYTRVDGAMRYSLGFGFTWIDVSNLDSATRSDFSVGTTLWDGPVEVVASAATQILADFDSGLVLYDLSLLAGPMVELIGPSFEGLSLSGRLGYLLPMHETRGELPSGLISGVACSFAL